MKSMTRMVFRLLVGLAFSALWPAMSTEAAPPAAKTVTARDGLTIACEARGRGDTALVFLHGWCGDREYWKRQVEEFAADYQVVTLDQAGHGESGKDRKAWTVA